MLAGSYVPLCCCDGMAHGHEFGLVWSALCCRRYDDCPSRRWPCPPPRGVEGADLRPFSPLDDAREAGGSLRVSPLGRRKARVCSGLADVRDFTTTRSSSVSPVCPVSVDSSPPPPAPAPPANVACPLGLTSRRFRREEPRGRNPKRLGEV